MPIVNPTYLLEVEWATGSYTDITVDCLRATIERSAGTINTNLSAGAASFLLDNNTGKYSPANTTSSLYNYLDPGRNVRLKATHSSSTYTLFSGTIKRYSVQPMLGPRTCLIDCEDQLGRVLDTELSLSLFTNTNPGSIFTQIMSACSVASFSVSSYQDVVPYAAFAGIKASSALDQLVKEGAYWIDNDALNTVQIRGRNFNPAGAVVASYNAMLSFSYSIDDSDIINSLRVSAEGRAQDTSVSTIAWIDPDSITVSPLTSETFWLSYVDPVNTTESAPATGVITPVSSSDYLIFTGSAQAGTNITSAVGVTVTAFGANAMVTLANSHATATAYVNKFQLQGYSVRALPPYSKVTEDNSSQLLYRKHEETYTNEYITGQSYINDYGQYVVYSRKEPRENMSMTLKSVFPDVLGNDVGELLHITEPITGLADRLTILGVSHDITLSSGIEHAVTYNFERWDGNSLHILNVSSLGTSALGF